MAKKAVILLSGGLDSTTTLALAQSQGYECYAISFRYGQRHSIELNAATAIAKSLQAQDHKIIDIDLRAFGGSALTADIDVPKQRNLDLKQDEQNIPITYVPARNTIFLSFALAYAETIEAWDIFIGANQVDYSGYPDCRPEFLKAFESMANLAIAAPIKEQKRIAIHYPLIDLTKAEIIQQGTKLGIDYSITTSCYDPTEDGKACGQCDSCQLRRKGFQDANIADPTAYSK